MFKFHWKFEMLNVYWAIKFSVLIEKVVFIQDLFIMTISINLKYSLYLFTKHSKDI